MKGGERVKSTRSKPTGLDKKLQQAMGVPTPSMIKGNTGKKKPKK
jgi:hypothetical protein